MRAQEFDQYLGTGLIVTAAQIHRLYEQHHYFLGSKDQVRIAAKAAIALGIEVLYDGELPYVESQKDFDKVAQYLIDREIDGYELYHKN